MTKIAVLGDWQYSPNDKEALYSCIKDINACSPNVVVQLGDYGSSLGCPEGIKDAAEIFSALECKNFYPILGNHDLQNETGDNIYPHGYIENVFLNAFGLKSKNNILEFENFRLFFFGLEPQPAKGFVTENECYMSRETLDFISSEINRRKGVPVIMFTHAPMFGCGLRTVPKVHVRASNAFLNQNREPESVVRLAEKHREIKLWFSGHYHIGQNYGNSRASKFGIDFFSTGVVSSASRDGSRHSRIIEINGDSATVFTLDHTLGKLCNPVEISLLKNDFCGYIHHKYNYFYNNADCSDGKIIHRFETACGNIVKNGVVLGKNGKLYVLTAEGFVWEINLEYGEAMGTLNYSDTVKISEIHSCENGILCVTSAGNRLFNYDNPKRFMREKDLPECEFEVVQTERTFNAEKIQTAAFEIIELDDCHSCICRSGEFLKFEIIKTK